VARRPRAVVRITGKHTIVQIIEAKSKGDRVLAAANSIELGEFGWKGGCGNVPAAYLTGYLTGFKSIQKGADEAVLDLGLRKASKGGRIFSALKGIIDSGVNIPCGEKVFPDQSRIRGDHIADYAKKAASNPELYKTRFSQYLLRKLKPEDLPSHFDGVKKRVQESFTSAVKKNE
jgi:large subunit ribosomal protein L18